jgi:hypothetical protein
MNNKQRKELATQLAALRPFLDTLDFSLIENTKDFVIGMAEEEDEKFNNLTEGLQNGEKGQAIEEAKNVLEDIAEALAEAHQALEALSEKLAEAIDHDLP